MTERAPRPTRDRHPARSARIIATGISVSGLVSLVTAFNVQALRQTATTATTPENVDSMVAPVLAPLANVVAQAPSTPQPAKVATPVAANVPVDTTIAVNVEPTPAPNRVVLEVPVTAPAPPAPSAVSSGSQ